MSSPSIAIKALPQLANYEGYKYPEAAAALKGDILIR